MRSVELKIKSREGSGWVVLVLGLAALFVWGHFSTPSASPTSLPTPSDPRWTQVVASLEDVIHQYNGEVGLYLKDLKTGKTFEFNADERFASASLIKLPVMAAACRAMVEGKLSLSTPITYRRQYRRGGSGHMKWLRTGSSFPISSLIYAMITDSDNTATAMVVDKLGYDYLNESFETFGLTTTRINPKGMSLSNRLDPEVENYTTPREMGALLEKIYRKELVGDGFSDFMLEVLKGAKHPTRLAKDLPRNWALARKTGLLRKNCHDVGILYCPSGDYVICVLTGQNTNYRVAKGFIANIGRKTYEILSSASSTNS
jgi:beta-lactamase class A